MTEPMYRYPGTRPFTSEDEAIFFGRKLDVDKLYQLMTLKNMLIFYSASGMGKSSLIKAGLIPRFKKETNEKSYLPLTIRFGAKIENADQRKYTLLSIVRAELLKHTDSLQNKSLAFSTHNELRDSLWCLVKLFEQNNVNLLLIFDQSEEIFTYDNDDINELKEEIYLLFNRNIPTFLHKRIQEKLVLLSDESLPTLREEISVNAKDTVHTTEDLDAVNKSIEFVYSPIKSKILFAVREDKLGLFNVFNDYFCDILKDTYKLLPLSKANAQEAIEGPSGIQGNFISQPFSYSSNALDKLLTNIREENGTYDPFSIQLNCSYIEVNCVIKEGKTNIEEDHIPDECKIVKEYYDNLWKTIPGSEDEIDKYKKEIEEKLIDQKQGTRKYVYEKDLSNISTILSLLQQKGLIRQDQRGDDLYVELSHDRLIAPLIEAGKQRAAEERIKEEYELALQKAAIEKASAGKRRKKMRTGIISVIGLFVVIILYLSYKNYQKGKEFEILQVYNLVDKTNPTLAYNVARAGRDEGFSVFDKFLENAENEKLGYITTAFIVPENITDAYLHQNQIIVLTKTAISFFKKNGFLDSTILINGEIVRSSFEKGEGFVIVRKLRDYSNSRSKDTFEVRTFRGAVRFKFTNEGLPQLLALSPTGQKVIADNREIIMGVTKPFDDYDVSTVGFFPDGSVIKGYNSGIVEYAGQVCKTFSQVYAVGGLNDSLILAYTRDNSMHVINIKNPIQDQDGSTTMFIQKKLSGEVAATLTYFSGNANGQVAVGGDDRQVSLYDVNADSTGNTKAERIAMLKGHTSRIISVSFSDDGKELVSVSGSREVFVWKIVKPSILYNNGEMKKLSTLDYTVLNLPEKNKTDQTTIEEKVVDLNNNTVSFVRLFYSDDYPDSNNVAIDIISNKFETVLRPPFSDQLKVPQKRFLNATYANINKFQLDRTKPSDANTFNSLIDKADSLEISNILFDTADVQKAIQFDDQFNYYIDELRKGDGYQQMISYGRKNIKLLRSFYVKDTTNEDIKGRLVNAYASLAFHLCFDNRPQEVIDNSLQGIALAAFADDLHATLIIGHLLSGNLNSAVEIYKKNKAKPGSTKGGLKSFIESYLLELKAFGIITETKKEVWSSVQQFEEMISINKSKK